MITPMTRSLDPLPGESLAGFLLRLSFRLGLPPAALIRRTGLAELLSTGQVYARTALGTALTPRLTADFATATRLSPDEVRNLTLEPLATRFPPARDAVLLPGTRWDWLFPTTRRYCPHCLAGDDSPIQRKYGGPWNVLWRLPDVFVCARHRCFLEHLCPVCRQPIVKRDLSQLIPRGNIAGLHPAQCRAPSPSRAAAKVPPTAEAACGWRLDQRTPPAPWDRPTTEHLALQQRILDNLSPDSDPEQTTRYFTELHLTSALVIATWPLGALPGRHRTTHTATTVLAERRQREASRTQASNAPPTDARACAGSSSPPTPSSTPRTCAKPSHPWARQLRTARRSPGFTTAGTNSSGTLAPSAHRRSSSRSTTCCRWADAARTDAHSRDRERRSNRNTYRPSSTTNGPANTWPRSPASPPGSSAAPQQSAWSNAPEGARSSRPRVSSAYSPAPPHVSTASSPAASETKA